MFGALADSLPIRAAVVATPLNARSVSAKGGQAAGGGAPSDVEWFDAGHPAPNEHSVAAGERTLTLARAEGGPRQLLVLLSGGASAMLVAPTAGVSLPDKIETSRRLMAAGAPIHELNCVRKHLSRIKGGQLAAGANRTITLALSDVHGPVPDDPSVIGSGPTVPDETTFGDALDVVRMRQVSLPSSVKACLERGVRGDLPETVKPGDPRLANAVYRVIGNRETAAEGARRTAEALGYTVIMIRPATAGEAREAGRAFAREAFGLGKAGGPLCVIASGETTVTVRGGGLGGRNQEFALAAVSELALFSDAERRPSGVVADGSFSRAVAIVLGSAGTDGIDGPTDAAGAIVDTTTLDRALHLGLDPAAALATNDAYRFFEPLGDLLLWGPTGTNVGDLHVLLLG